MFAGARPLLACLILALAAVSFAAASAAPAPAVPAANPQSPTTPADSAEVTIDASTAGKAAATWAACPGPGKHITCLLATEKTLYAGTEDTGLWKCDLAADPTKAASWQPMTGADGPGNDIYGLAQDADGRLWVGTQNRGVSVWNGKAWKTYGVIDGCIGERVFCIAADAGYAVKPDSGRAAVWIATDHGLTSWTPEDGSPKSKVEGPKSAAPGATGGLSASAPFATRGIVDPNFAQGAWRSFTKADGLPSSQIYAVAVDPKGRVFAGTECDGLA